MKIPVLYIVIPCYNEEKVLPITSKEFLKKIHELEEKELISKKSRILFVNDGSKDSTWQIITALAQSDEHYMGISQSRNRGHQQGSWKPKIVAILQSLSIVTDRMILMQWIRW